MARQDTASEGWDDSENGVNEIESAAAPAIALEPANSAVLSVIESAVVRTATVQDEKQVMRKKREPIGLFHSVCIIKEIEDPYEFQDGVKMLLVGLYAFAGMVPAMGSAMFYPAVHNIAAAFDTTLSVINLSVGFYMFSLGVFPLWWSYLSETKGRRAVYISSFLLFVLFNIGCALANSITMLIVFRILAGAAAASSQSVGAGAIGDIYVPSERGRANSYFYLGPLCGPMISPIIAGALNERWGWRSTQYFLIIVGGISVAMMLFFLPETLRPQMVKPEVLEKRALRKEKNRAAYYAQTSYEFFIGPFKAFKLLVFPSFMFAIFYNSFGYGALYMMNNTIDSVFAKAPYNFSSIIIGVLYLPNGLGYVLGSLLGGRWADRIIQRSLKKNNGVLIPEARLAENMIVAGVVVCGGMVMFGWTIDKKLFWFVPIIGTFMFGFGSLIIFTTTLTYLVDSMPKQRSGAVSINTFIRCITAAVCTFVTVPLENAIGTGWTFTILTIIGLAFLAMQVYVRKKGSEWRARMVNMETG